MYKTSELFDFSHSLASSYLMKYEYPWQALAGIKEMIIDLGKSLDSQEYRQISENVWVHCSAIIADSAYVGGPCIIGANTQIRHCAFIRESALIGDNCVVGNSCELKNVILFDNVEVPHFNYVGDSILGFKAHMGAGSITSNVRADRKLVTVHGKDQNMESGIKKFGAMLGDYVEVGCNAVLNPGTVVGKNSNIYPLSCVRGMVEENSIYKKNDEIVKKENEKR